MTAPRRGKIDWAKTIIGAIAGVGVANGWEISSDTGCAICGSKKNAMCSVAIGLILERPGEVYCAQCMIGVKEIIVATIEGMKAEAARRGSLAGQGR